MCGYSSRWNRQRSMVLYEPYQDTVDGVYRIILHYTVKKNPQNGYGAFDKCSSDGR